MLAQSNPTKMSRRPANVGTPRRLNVGETSMAIADVAEYAHLSEADIEALGCELEAIRRDIEDSRGEKDSAYIQRAIAFQRCLDVAARLVIAGSQQQGRHGLSEPPRWPWPRASRTWNSATTSATVNGIG